LPSRVCFSKVQRMKNRLAKFDILNISSCKGEKQLDIITVHYMKQILLRHAIGHICCVLLKKSAVESALQFGVHTTTTRYVPDFTYVSSVAFYWWKFCV
jgi:hypothetical protein